MVLCRPGGRWMLGCCCWFLLFLILVPLLFLSGPMSSSVPPPVVSAAAAAGDRLRDFSLVLWCLSSGMDSHVSGMWTDGCWTLPHTLSLSLRFGGEGAPAATAWIWFGFLKLAPMAVRGHVDTRVLGKSRESPVGPCCEPETQSDSVSVSGRPCVKIACGSSAVSPPRLCFGLDRDKVWSCDVIKVSGTQRDQGPGSSGSSGSSGCEAGVVVLVFSFCLFCSVFFLVKDLVRSLLLLLLLL